MSELWHAGKCSSPFSVKKIWPASLGKVKSQHLQYESSRPFSGLETAEIGRQLAQVSLWTSHSSTATWLGNLNQPSTLLFASISSGTLDSEWQTSRASLAHWGKDWIQKLQPVLQARFGVSTEACQCDHQQAREGKIHSFSSVSTAGHWSDPGPPAPACTQLQEFHFFSLVPHQGPVGTAKSCNLPFKGFCDSFSYKTIARYKCFHLKKVLPDYVNHRQP